MTQHDPTDTRTLERNRQNSADRARQAEQLEIDDVKWLMSNKRGRRVVSRLLEKAGVFRLSFNTDPVLMSFNEGQRNSGLRLLAQITEHCPDRYMEMLKESKQ